MSISSPSMCIVADCTNFTQAANHKAISPFFHAASRAIWRLSRASPSGVTPRTFRPDLFAFRFLGRYKKAIHSSRSSDLCDLKKAFKAVAALRNSPKEISVNPSAGPIHLRPQKPVRNVGKAFTSDEKANPPPSPSEKSQPRHRSHNI